MLKYQYALANVWWNRTGQDQPLFLTAEQMETYFDGVRTDWGDLMNFNIGDSVQTSIYIRTQGLTTNQVLDYRYVLVRELDGDQVVKTYHYFAELTQDSGSQYLARLTRDVIVDYYCLGEVRNRSYTYIMRTHLNRFIEDGSIINVNGGIDSPLYIAEDIDADAPLCISNERVNMYNASPLSSDKDLIRDVIKNITWVYVYVKPNNIVNIPSYMENNIDMGYGVLVYALYNQTGSVHNILYEYNTNFYNLLLPPQTILQQLTPYIINIRTTYCPPSSLMFANPGLDNIQNSLVIQDNVAYGVGVDTEHGFLYLSNRNVNGDLDNLTNGSGSLREKIDYINNLPSISKSYIKSPKTWSKEVKLYNGIIKAYLASGNNQGQAYNLLSLIYNQYNPTGIIWVESLVAGITRYYLGFQIVGSSPALYNANNFLTLSQNSNSLDSTIPFSENQYDTFLANNKNFYQQTNKEYEYSLAKNIADVGSNLISNPTPFGLLTGVVNTSFAVGDYAMANLQRQYQMDNLHNAPVQMHNIDGNGNILLGITSLCPRFEVWQPLQSNLDKIADRLFFYGYNYQKIGKLTDFDNTRKYFNYIECDIAGIKYNMNDKAYEILRSRLINGIRFWHTNPVEVDFNTTDNYEVWVDSLP